jgi:hypothetical protein
MARTPRSLLMLVTVAAAVALAGCGGSGGGSSSTAAASAARSDAKSAATGDIPDNQVFLVFHDGAAGYAIRYPEGWTQQGAGAEVAFVDRDNAIHVVVTRGPAPTTESVNAALARLVSSQPTLRVIAAPRRIASRQGSVLKVGYSVDGPANGVTGKRPLLLVDRYVYARSGEVATVDLATPKGVDNVDAYRLIARSFAWR